jgi:hypothetical protein
MSKKKSLLESVKRVIDLHYKIVGLSETAESVKSKIKDELADAAINHTIGLKEFEKVSEQIDAIDEAATVSDRYVEQMNEPLERIKEHLIFMKPGYSLAYIDPETKTRWIFNIRKGDQVGFTTEPAA